MSIACQTQPSSDMLPRHKDFFLCRLTKVVCCKPILNSFAENRTLVLVGAIELLETCRLLRQKFAGQPQIQHNGNCASITTYGPKWWYKMHSGIEKSITRGIKSIMTRQSQFSTRRTSKDQRILRFGSVRSIVKIAR